MRRRGRRRTTARRQPRRPRARRHPPSPARRRSRPPQSRRPPSRRRRSRRPRPSSEESAPAESSAEAPADTGPPEGTDLGLEGKKVTINGPEVAVEADGFQASFAPFEERTGIKVEYAGSRDFDTQISVALESGQTPDIANIPQPGKILGAADKIPGVPDDVKATVSQNWDSYWSELVTDPDGRLLGVPNKADLKSLVWYSPKSFEENGWTVPTTWDEFTKLQEDMLAAGKTPWCIGVESGDATGWTLTDWIEDFMLRMKGPDVYDQWVNHEIPFNDPQVKEVVQAVADIWFKDGNVLAEPGRDRLDRLRRRRSAAARRRVRAAPPGQLLRRQLDGRGRRRSAPTAT